MSGSEIGVISSIGMNNHNQPAASSQPVIHSMHLGYGGDGEGGSAVYKPSEYQGNGGMGEPLKKKRGRPRKYGSDGAMAQAVPLSAAPPPPPQPQAQAAVNLTQPSGTFSPPPSAPPPQQPPQEVTGSPLAKVSSKKSRGRPPGSSKKQQLETLGSPGINFTPHVITVKAGEDVASKIMSFSHNGPRAICILSANGAISNVTLRQAATSGGSVTYEGRFEILSLSGSFMLSDSGGQRSRTGGLSVSLAGPDGRVVGGGVAGLLTAASPVQVVVGSFFPDYRREINMGNQTEPSSKHHNSGMGQGSPPSRGTLSESSGGGPGSPLNQSTVNSTPQGMHGLPWK